MALDWSRTVFGAELEEGATESSAPGEESGGRPDSSAILDELVEIVVKARAVDTREYEGLSVEQLSSGLVPLVGAIVDEGISAIESLGEHYGRSAERTSPEEAVGGIHSSRDYMRTMDGVVERKTGRATVSDIAFLSGRMLQAKAKELRTSIKRADAWGVIADCGSALRGLQKAASAVEAAACEADGGKPRLTYVSEVQVAIETRTAYTKLRTAVLAGGDADESDVVARVRTAVTSIAKLVGRDVYASLRLIDRVPLRELQGRMLEWLAKEPPDRRDGVRIWQDCAGFVSLLRAVNQREELVEHDRECLTELMASVGEMSPREPVADPRFLASSRRLLGRDEELDVLIEAGAGSPSKRWSSTIERVMAVHMRPAF